MTNQTYANQLAGVPTEFQIDTPYSVTNTTTGRTFRVKIEYDPHQGPPQEECDGHGVTVTTNWLIDPTDVDDINYQLGLDEDDDTPHAMEKRLQYSMMLPLRDDGYRWNERLYYDVWETLKQARAEGWGSIDHDNDPDAQNKLHEVVMEDYRYIKSWYDDEWCWVTVHVQHIDEHGDETEHSTVVGGYEYGYYNPRMTEYLREAAVELVEETEYSVQRSGHERQMALPLT